MDIKVINGNELKKGDTILVDNQFISKVTDIKTSAPGKHGHSKSRVEAVGVIDNKKRVFIITSEDKVQIPIIDKRNAQVISVNADRAQLMDLETYEVFDADIPEDLEEKIKEGVQVVYSDLMTTKMIKGLK